MYFILSLLLTAFLVYRAQSRKSLTPLGTFTAAVTALVHAIHPWSTLWMSLLIGFYGAGTWATKLKHDVKSQLTVSSSGGKAAITRTHVQVLANSVTASLLIAFHAWLIKDEKEPVLFDLGRRRADALVVGVMAHYAAVASDTLSSELGILATSPPRLILPPFPVVLPGTNGGCTLYGLLSGTGGSLFIATLSVLLTPFSQHNNSISFKSSLFLLITVGGIIGTLLDSFLGATLQASVVDVKRNKIVESEGGTKVLVQPSSSIEKVIATSVRGKVQHGEGKRTKIVAGADPSEPGVNNDISSSRKILVGRDLVSNNAVNLLMAGSVAGLGVLWGLRHAS